MSSKIVLGMFTFIFLMASQPGYSCSWGTNEFACCLTSSIPNSPERRILTGCAVSNATAWARCVAVGFPASDLRLNWGGTQCRSGSSNPGNSSPTHHACSIARRGNNSFTYYAYGPKSNSSKEQICNKARQFNTTGKSSTHWWYTTYWPNKMHKAIADCENGTWVAYDYGVQSILKVNQIRKNNGGRGCLFKVDKSWTP